MFSTEGDVPFCKELVRSSGAAISGFRTHSTTYYVALSEAREGSPWHLAGVSAKEASGSLVVERGCTWRGRSKFNYLCIVEHTRQFERKEGDKARRRGEREVWVYPEGLGCFKLCGFVQVHNKEGAKKKQE
jgi:hypothetical protein